MQGLYELVSVPLTHLCIKIDSIGLEHQKL